MDQEIKLPDSFDEFLKEEKVDSEEKKSLANTFEEERATWTDKITGLSKRLKKIEDIADLQVSLYTERQLCLERYHYLMSLLITINKKYKREYAIKYDYYSNGSQVRYPNETIKNNKILSDLEDLVYKREQLENQYKFIDGTVKTLDNLIYGIKYRIEAEQIMRGK